MVSTISGYHPVSGATSAEATTPSTQLSSAFGEQTGISKQPSVESEWMDPAPGEGSRPYGQAPFQGY